MLKLKKINIILKLKVWFILGQLFLQIDHTLGDKENNISYNKQHIKWNIIFKKFTIIIII